MSDSSTVSTNYHRAFGFYFTLGVIYSLYLTIAGKLLLQFLPNLSLLHAIFSGTILGLLGCLTTFFQSKRIYPYLFFLLWILPGLHFAYWQSQFGSRYLVLDTIPTSVFLIVFPVLVAGVLLLLDRYVKPQVNFTMLAVIVGMLLLAKFLVLSWLPSEYLLKKGRYFRTVKQTDHTGSLNNIIYPLSRPLPAGIEDYQFLLPDIPDGSKLFVILLDAFRADYLNKELSGQAIAPTMNRLAENNLRFTNYRAQASWTKPSIASLFTGKYVAEHETYWGHTPPDSQEYEGHALPKTFDTLAERLKEQGFETMGTVKSGHLSSRYHYDQGFDLYLDLLNGYRGDFNSHKQVLFWLYHSTPRDAFVYVHVNGPHQPFDLAYHNKNFMKKTQYYSQGKLNVPGRFTFTRQDMERVQQPSVELTPKEVEYLRTLYASELNFYDRYYVKPLLGTLKELELYHESLVTITADHGEGLYEHERYAHGKNLYEEIIHIPLIMKFPQNARITSQTNHHNLETIDLTATLLDYASASTGDLSGESFLPLITEDSQQPQSEADFQYAYSEHAKNTDYVPLASVVSPPWKYIYNFETETGSLYNLDRDPLEQQSLRNHDTIRNQLKEALFEEVRSDSSISRERSRVKEATEKGFEQFENLGYVD